jgi:nucleoside-diphosphate-sugar epimerase
VLFLYEIEFAVEDGQLVVPDEPIIPIIFGDGEQSRDFTYVNNAVEANISAAE